MNFRSNFGNSNNNDFFGDSLFPTTSLSNRFFNDPFFARERNFDRFFGDFDESFGHYGNSNRNNHGNDNETNENFFNSRFGEISNLNQNMPGSSFVSKSYCSTVSYNGSGEPVREVFKSESYNTVDASGKKIGESKTAYENTAKGIQKAAHEKHLDDKAYKIVKEKELNSGEEIESNYYKGLNENDLDQFNSEFTQHKEKVKNDYYNRLGADNRFGTRSAINYTNNVNPNANDNHGKYYLGHERQ